MATWSDEEMLRPGTATEVIVHVKYRHNAGQELFS